MQSEVLDAPGATQNIIVFENDGLIDPVGITTFGVNAKVTDNPIGYFGTGLKYAIAVLLRCGQSITIYRGTDPLEFDLERKTLRGKDFDIVRMNGAPLGFTTDLGKTWEMWQAFRELWCNCKDEGGTTYETTKFSPKAGRTTIIVEGSAFAQAYAKRGEVILDSAPLFSLNGVDVHPKRAGGDDAPIFYRGIAVARHVGNRLPIHAYNITGRLELTEDRTVKWSWQPSERLAEAIQMTDRVDFIEECLRAPATSFEGSLDFSFHGVTPNEAFLSTVARLSASNGGKINETAKSHAHKYRKTAPPLDLILDHQQQEQLDTAMAFCQDLGFGVDKFPIKFVQALGDGAMLGLAFDGHIFLTRNAFDAGTKQVAITLIEEFIHLHHGVKDETRPMQERLLHELVNIGERHLGRAL